MKQTALTVVVAILAVVLLTAGARAQDLALDAPPVVLTDVPFDVPLAGDGGAYADREVVVRIGDTTARPRLDDDGVLVASGLVVPASGATTVSLEVDGAVVDEAALRSLPGWISVLPPLLAILIALLTRNVIPALFLGVWSGAMAMRGFSPTGAFMGLLDAFQVYVLAALADADHASIVLFTLMIGGMVGIVTRNGGMQGVVDRIAPLARTPQRAQAATGMLGLGIFFDDYANVLVVGGTMRQITDALRVSREKLAYIVDSTAAPVSCIALVTTWIGFEVGLIDTAMQQIDGFEAFGESAYSIFLGSIAYSFYPWLAMLLVFIVAVSGRDFGPMLRAERRARRDGAVADDADVADDPDAAALRPPPTRPHRAINAVIPVVVLVAGVVVGLWVTGGEGSLRERIGNADSYQALMWASLLSVVTAVALTLGQRILSLRDTVDAWYAGMRSMLLAMVILILAWALSGLTKELHTAPYLISVLGDALQPALIPAVTFVLAAAVAFATGTSWGTMGILIPLVIPLVWAILVRDGIADAGHAHLVYSTVACTLGGAVWGDHCSPISDTTVLSSLASGCDHIEHVRTQLPYAALAGAAAMGLGIIPAGYGVPWWVCLPLAAAVLGVAYFALARPVTSDLTGATDIDAQRR